MVPTKTQQGLTDRRRVAHLRRLAARAASVLLLLGLCLVVWACVPRSRQECPTPHPLAQGDALTVQRLAEAELAGYQTPGIADWEIVSLEGLDDWAVIAVTPLAADGTSLPGDGDILLARRDQEEWQVALPGTATFDDWLERVPEELLVPFPERGIYRVAIDLAGPSSGVYKLPYACGDRAYVSRAGDDHDNAIDFLVGSATGGQDWIVAAQDGWVHQIVQYRTACCCASSYSSNWIILRHPNGEYSYYVHLTPYSPVVQQGEWVEQGQPIATEGDVGYSCSTAGGTCKTRYCDVPGYWDYCCEHLHFEVRDSGSWGGNRLNPRFEDVPGEFVQSGYAYYSGNCGEPDPPTPPTDLQPTCGTWYEQGGNRFTNSRRPCFTWHAPEEAGAGFQGYYAAIDDTTPDGYALHGNDQWVGDVTTWDVPHAVGEGARLVAVTAVNEAGRSVSAPYRFVVDTVPPSNPTIVDAGCTSKNNRWQNECYDPAFTWDGASDAGGSGVQDYHYYWGSSEQGVPTEYTTDPALDPGPVAPPDGCSVSYLNLATRDHLDQEGVSGPAFVLRYDGGPPTSTVLLDGGAESTSQLTVRLDVAAGDGCSGVAQMRISSYGLEWSEWLSYQATLEWNLPALNDSWLPVYVQVRDRAGNLSIVAEDSIYLDLYPEAPRSAGRRPAATNGLVAAGTAPRTSASVQPLPSSWPDLMGPVPPALVPPSTVLSSFLAPTMASNPVREPEDQFFRFQAGEPGILFTNQVTTVLHIDAPAVSQLQVDRSPSFGATDWRPYVHALPWQNLIVSGAVTGTRLYARFQDEEGTIYGAYESTWFYDAVPPAAGAHVVTITGDVALLAVEASDDNSGVHAMRVAADPSFVGAQWQVYTDTLTTTWPVDGVVYVQFRDRAGNLSWVVPVRERYILYVPLVLSE